MHYYVVAFFSLAFCHPLIVGCLTSYLLLHLSRLTSLYLISNHPHPPCPQNAPSSSVHLIPLFSISLLCVFLLLLIFHFSPVADHGYTFWLLERRRQLVGFTAGQHKCAAVDTVVSKAIVILEIFRFYHVMPETSMTNHDK